MRAHASVAAALVLSLAGCSSSPADVMNKATPGSYVELAAHNKYLDHPSPAVSGPAGLGLGIGTILGIPVMIAALPVTLGLGIAAFSDDPKTSNLAILGNAIAWPDAICAVGGSYAFGSLPALFVGDAPPKASRVATPPPGPPLDAAPDAPRGRRPAGPPIGPPPGLDADSPPVAPDADIPPG